MEANTVNMFLQHLLSHSLSLFYSSFFEIVYQATGVYNADKNRASRMKYSFPSFVIVSLSLGIFYSKV